MYSLLAFSVENVIFARHSYTFALTELLFVSFLGIYRIEMNLLQYTLYACCACITLMPCVMLSLFRSGSLRKEYRVAKRYLSVGMLIYSLLFALCAWNCAQMNNAFFVNCYMAPPLNYFGFMLLTFAVCKMLHTRDLRTAKVYSVCIPTAAVYAVMLVGFLWWSKASFDLVDVKRFVGYHDVRTISVIFFVLSMIGILILVRSVIHRALHFERMVNNYYADDALLNNVLSHYRWYVIGGYAIATLCVVVSILFSFYNYHVCGDEMGSSYSVMGYQHMAVMMTLISIVNSVVVINVQGAYEKSVEAFDDMADEQAAGVDDEKENESLTAQEGQSGQTESLENSEKMMAYNQLQVRLQKWVTSTPLPYLSGGLTLGVMADQLGVSRRILSDYLNTMLNVNFNTYINRLRVQHVKTLLVENPTMVVADIALSSGFNDASAMSKVFKRFTGTTPGAYRQENVRDK